MGDKSGIEWTDATWNPITGCSKVSPGCAYCYAETLALTRMAGQTGYPGLPWTPENAEANVMLRPGRLDQPLRWKRPRRIFVNSMSDLFHELVPEEFIDRVFAVMAMAHQHTFQVLTKRPERMRAYLERAKLVGGGPVGVWDGPAKQLDILQTGQRIANETGRVGAPISIEWPLPNVWLGTSVENQHWAEERIPHLLATPAAVRFLSCEPLLGPLDLRRVWTGDESYIDALAGEEVFTPQHVAIQPRKTAKVDWVIVGGESGGPERRRLVTQEPVEAKFVAFDPPFVHGWRPKVLAHAIVARMRDECIETDTPFLFKQWGGPTAKSAGRLLDGRTWDGYPAS